MKSKLSHRLLCAAEEIGEAESIADIGTDHGQLVIYALENKNVRRAFAVDISEKSLLKAKRSVEERGLGNRVSFFVGDGLEPLQETPDVTVIAGIGGNEIVNILKKTSADTRFIFIPHNDAHILREFLCSNNYKIIKDYVIKDGKFYALIVAEKNGGTQYDRAQIILGADNPHTDAFVERLLYRKEKIEEILSDEKTFIDRLQPELREEYKEICKWLESMT